MRHVIVLSIRLVSLLLLAACGMPSLAAGADSAGPELIPEDTCIIELTLPPGAVASLDGDNYSAQREFVSRGLEPRRIYETTVHVRSADGKRLEAPILRKGGERIRLALQDPHAPQPVPQLQLGHRGGITCAAFSPDGRRILTGSDDQTMMLWDAATAKLLRVFAQEGGAVECLAFSPDGRQVVCGLAEGKVVLWDAATGAKLRTLQGHEQTVHAVAFSPDGRLVLTGSEDATAVLWDAATGARVRTLSGHTGAVNCALFSPDGRLVLTGSEDETAVLWDTANGTKRRTFPHKQAVTCAAFSPNGARVATGVGVRAGTTYASGIGRLHYYMRSLSVRRPIGDRIEAIAKGPTEVALWDSSNGGKLLSLEAPGTVVTCVTFSPDGSQLLAGADAQTAVLWDSTSGAELRSLEGHIGTVSSVEFGPDGSQVLTGGEDGKAILWDLGVVGVTRTLSHPFPPAVPCVAIRPDGANVVVGAEDGNVVVWDTASGRPARILESLLEAATCAAFTPDGEKLITGYLDGDVILWNTTTWSQMRLVSRHTDAVTSIACCADGRHVVTGSLDDTAILWDLSTGEKVRTFKEGATASIAADAAGITGVAILPNGGVLLTGAKDKTAILWDMSKGERIRRLAGHSGGVTCVACSPDGKKLVTGSTDGRVLAWDAVTGQQLKSLDGHCGDVTTAKFSPDGMHLFSTASKGGWFARFWEKVLCFLGPEEFLFPGRANTKWYFLAAPHPEHSAILWDPNFIRQPIPVINASVKVTCSAFSADSRYALTGTEDGRVQVIDVLAGRLLLDLLSLNHGEDWLAVTPEGLFDGSPGGRERVSYRIDPELNVVPVDRFIEDLYRPGLLAEMWRGQRPLPDVDLGKSLPPVLKIVAPAPGTLDVGEVAVTVEAEDQGGGISGPWLMQNDARVAARFEESQQGTKLRRRFTLSLVEGVNRLQVRAASRDGAWESEPAEIVLRYDKPPVPPELYVVAVGIGDYADPSMKVRFAAQDARDLLDAFKERGGGFYGQDRVHLFPLLNGDATKARLKTVLTEELAPRAKKQDLFVLFLAGHGALVGQRYYFIPHEFKSAGIAGNEEIRSQGLPQDELEDWITAVPALKRVLIYDTCHSGGVITASRFARDPFAVQKTLAQMSRSSGTFIVAAAPAGDEALDVPELGHGALTYALLAGLGAVDRGPLKDRTVQPKDRNLVTVRDWFGFAQDEVPSLTRLYHHGREQFVHFIPGRTNFPILPLKAAQNGSQPP